MSGNLITFAFIMLISAWMLLMFFARKSVIATIIMLGFIIRATAAIVFDTGIKYSVAWDSIVYEKYAWHLAKFWSSSRVVDYEISDRLRDFNFYEIVLAVVFYLFGNNSFVASIFNCIIGTLTILFVYLIAKNFLCDRQDAHRANWVGGICAGLLVLYPSFIVWSALNIRDPLYYFCCVLMFYFLFQTFSPRSNLSAPARVLNFMGVLFSFLAILGIRNYIGWIFVAGIGIGLVMTFLSMRFHPRNVMLLILFFAVSAVYTYAHLYPTQVSDMLLELQKYRLSFSNIGADDYAGSSFELDYQFSTVSDVLLFIPRGLTYYIFAPFPWATTSLRQSLAMTEVIPLYLLIYPTWIGIRSTFQRAKFETSVLLSFSVLMAVLQCTVISNMGTIFRHRTLGFILISIFTAIGIYEIWQKNHKNFFKA